MALCPCNRPLLIHTPAGDTQTQFWLSLCGVSGSWCTQGLSEPSKCLWLICGLILKVILPLLLSCWGFSFALGHGVSFFGRLQHSSVDGCSAASCNFGVLAGEDEPTSSYSTILELMDNCFTMCAIFCCTIQWTSYACAYVLCCAHSLSDVRLFATPWTAACQASMSITNSQSLLKLMSIESVMPSNHLILCHPLLLPPSIFPSIRVFSMSQFFT